MRVAPALPESKLRSGGRRPGCVTGAQGGLPGPGARHRRAQPAHGAFGPQYRWRRGHPEHGPVLGRQAGSCAGITVVGISPEYRGLGAAHQMMVSILQEEHRNGTPLSNLCASAMSVLVQGRTIDEALQLQPEDVVQELDGLPDDHLHCARLAVNTLGEAIAEYYRRQLTDRRDRSGKAL